VSRLDIERAHAAGQAAARFVAGHQRDDGSIPALPDGRVDPWNHVECAMALDVAGRHVSAVAAYQWVAALQEDDGAMRAAYVDGCVVDATRNVNFSTYLAVGVWHHYLLTRDLDFLRDLWPSIERAVEFALALQAEDGAVYWARDAEGNAWADSLVAGASSVRAAIRCAEEAAAALGDRRTAGRWALRRLALDAALRADEQRWGGTLPEDTSRYAMHWYYPVLCGAVTGAAARARIEAGWPRFVSEGEGCRCVDDRPWVTVAESSELALALDACGMREQARGLLAWQLDHQEPDGGFRTGTVPRYGPWPDGERPTWTAAAVVLAADAVYDLTPAGGLFRALGG
jgi:hypothetical protein